MTTPGYAAVTAPTEDPKKRCMARHAALKTERETWRSHWTDLADFILPRRQRWLSTDVNRGGKKNGNIIDSTATFAVRTLQSGMQTGMTSQARPWFRLTVPNADLADDADVKLWLFEVENLIRQTFDRSNLYNCLPVVYGDDGVFGTAAMLWLEDAQTVVRGYVLAIGTYYLATDAQGRVDTLFREIQMTVRQIVSEFGGEDGKARAPNEPIQWGNISDRVKTAWQAGGAQLESWIPVMQVIEPNDSQVIGRADYRGMPYRSVYYEMEGRSEGYLRESGFQERPFMAPRWAVTSEDVYGSSPGMDALGDIKALQLYEKRSAMVIDKIANPPMNAPAALRAQRASLLPGDVNYVDVASGGQKFESAYTPDARAVELIARKQAEHQNRIQRAFYSDLFRMLTDGGEGVQPISAREVEEKHEEKLLMLGPVLEQITSELLSPIIDRTFAILHRRGLLPPPPDKLQGADLKIEYISILAQAQRLVGTAGIERLSQYVVSLAAASPEALDNLDLDESIDAYAEMLGIPPKVVRSDADVSQIRAQRAQQQKMQAAAAQAGPMAKAAKDAAATPMGGDTALTRALSGGVPGVVGPAGAPGTPGVPVTPGVPAGRAA